jgi:hypothetical protein
VIECSLIDLIPELRHTLVLLIWLHWSDHILSMRWEWWAIIPSCPVFMIVFYHALAMSWKSLVITPFGQLNRNYVCALLLWGLLLVSASKYSVKVCRMSNLSALTFKSASQSCLRILLDCLVNIQEQSRWSSRLPQEIQRRSSRWAHTSSWDSISSNNVIVGRTCRFHHWLLWEIRPQKGWWYRLWMCLNPI